MRVYASGQAQEECSYRQVDKMLEVMDTLYPESSSEVMALEKAELMHEAKWTFGGDLKRPPGSPLKTKNKENAWPENPKRQPREYVGKVVK